MLSVVVFHAFPGRLSGGFIGVDVFFVISGFLITKIILGDLERQEFSIWDFYSRRIKRIFPALFLVLAGVLALGSVVLFSGEFAQLGKHVSAGAGFVANIVLRDEVGYFDVSSDLKPLLHLWSLGVEEQFYLIWPVLLIICFKFKAKPIFLMLIVGASSFALSLFEVSRDPSAAFFSPQTRFWELLVGSCLAWHDISKDGNQPADATIRANNNLKNMASTGGIIALIAGFFFMNKAMPFPGAWALVPVFGTAALIWAGPYSWINKRLLSQPLAVWFGLISFPLYLWHWPLLSFLRITEYGSPSPAVRICAVALSIFFAWLTYLLIEHPIRRARAHQPIIIATLVFLVATAGLVGYASHKGIITSLQASDRDAFLAKFENKYPDWRYFTENDLINKWRSECAYFDRAKYMETGKLDGGAAASKPIPALAPSCYIRDNRFKHAVMIWGDSHAQSLSWGISENMPKDWQILQVASAGCAPNPNVKHPSTANQCEQSNYTAMQTAGNAKPDVVVVAQAQGHNKHSMESIESALRSAGVKRVVFVGPAPIWVTPLPNLIARYLWIEKPSRTIIGVNMDVKAANDRLISELSSTNTFEYVDLWGTFCNEKGCMTYLGDDVASTITSWDEEHLSPYASEYFAHTVLVNRIVGRMD